MTTPICRCRVLYLGSSVPHITKDGLQGIQEPLRELYPEQGPFTAKGIDSWLSVWSNGLLLENVDESHRQVTRFFPIEALHYCAAVRYVVVPGNNGERVEKFLPLDSPFSRHANPNHPSLFACILRRTSGIKVLECHAFICKKEAAANALVRCCFHAYADSIQAHHLEENPYYMETRRSRSMSGLNTIEKVEVWRNHSDSSTYTNGRLPEDDNYKVWTGSAPTEREMVYVDAAGTMRSVKSNMGTTRSTQSKPRQMMLPSRPPPPPSPQVGKEGKSNKLLKPKSKVPKGNKKELIPNGHRHLSPPSHNIYGGSGLYTERRIRRPDRPPLPGSEEPIYIAAGRPLSPMTSYQPSGYTYEPYFLQYGTAPRNKPPKNEKKKQEEKTEEGDLESPFNTGIYRKKGHLNERAFSYSIRQEHRSRSNSLANLQFFANGTDEVDPSAGPSGMGSRDEDRKERELAQLVSGLELKENGDGPESNFIRKKAPTYQR